VNYLFSSSTAGNAPLDIGDKALSMLRLNSLCNVPDWFAVPTKCFADLIAEPVIDSHISEILKKLTSGNAEAISAEIKELICAMDLPASLLEEMNATLKKVIGADLYVAVRLSSVAESGNRHACAGIKKCYLYVKGLDQVCDCLRKVWASIYDARALIYRRQNNLPLHPLPVAVVVQRMICSKTSGVVFTTDPVTQNPFTIVISALYGLGSGLVGAGLKSDHFTFDKRTGSINTAVSVKARQLLMNRSTCCGVHVYAVDSELHSVVSLPTKSIKQLASTALRIEKHCGRPQDIEFCFDESDELHILQARDTINIREYGPAAGNSQIWGISNAFGSYSGITSPMTFSFIHKTSASEYLCLIDLLGISRRKRADNEELCRDMHGFFKGRVYLNLSSWDRLVKQVPGYNYNKKMINCMMGVPHETDAWNDSLTSCSASQRYLIELPRLLLLAGRMMSRFMFLGLRVQLFSRHFERCLKKWSSLCFNQMHPHELMSLYKQLEKQLILKRGTPVLNDLYVMIFSGFLKKYCKVWCSDKDETLYDRLIRSGGGLAGTGPTIMLMQIALMIKKVNTINELFVIGTPEELAAAIATLPECAQIAKAVDKYIELYGFSSTYEFKLEEPLHNETPEFVYQILRNYAGMSDMKLDVNAMIARERIMRVEAQQCAFEYLSGLRRIMFRFVLSNLRKGITNRENIRIAHTQICGLIRQILNGAGQQMARENIIGNDQDIYYLTMDELWDYIKGAAATTDLRALIEIRLNEYDSYFNQELELSDCFNTYGMAYNRNSFVSQKASGVSCKDNSCMQGISCSPGRVKGTARVVHSPRDDMHLHGEILVASCTDPGLVALCPSVSCVLIERGSILSQIAVVARSMGIPAIIGIPGLINAVQDGSSLVVDANAGTVNLV